MKLIAQKANKLVDENKVDDLGEPYRHTVWDYKGNKIEVNTDRYGHHAKANDDNSTMKTNMDDGGLVGWFMSLFGKK